MQTENERQGVLVTCDADSDRLVVEELRRIGVCELPGNWLDTGDAVQGSILQIEAKVSYAAFSAAVEASGSIFARHLAPIDFEIALRGDESDIQALASLTPAISERMNPRESFSVQTRLLGEGKLPYRKVVVNETLSQAIESSTSATMDCREPTQVVSVLCTPDRAYIGISPTRLNRSAWPGGKHRFKRDDDQVSRAEFKLLEAFSVFGLGMPDHGYALDIGASPGGWTRVLAAGGLRVDAVDPGDLDPRLRQNPLVTHLRKRIQEYAPSAREFRVIVNDMKMDARESVQIMLGFASRLADDGFAVMTLKMPKANSNAAAARKSLQMLRFDLDRLATGFEIIGARQLYHNRSEVTVAMRAKK